MLGAGHSPQPCKVQGGLFGPLVVQWVKLRAPNAGGLGLIPGQGTRSCMHAANKTRCSKIN